MSAWVILQIIVMLLLNNACTCTLINTTNVAQAISPQSEVSVLKPQAPQLKVFVFQRPILKCLFSKVLFFIAPSNVFVSQSPL